MKNADCFINEKDYPDLKYDRAVRNLQSAIRFRTVNHLDTGLTDYSQFDALHAFLRSSYPLLALNARWGKIGHSLLICLNGSDETLLPALFMAHQDVVPVVEGTEKNWVHGPFSGDLEDGFIWGRGAMDIKQMLIAEMESAEYLLSKGMDCSLIIPECREDGYGLSQRSIDRAVREGAALAVTVDCGITSVSMLKSLSILRGLKFGRSVPSSFLVMEMYLPAKTRGLRFWVQGNVSTNV